MEKIKQYYSEHFHISDKDWDIFASKLLKQSFSKKEIILSDGETEHYLSFIDQGIVRFYIPRENNDITFGFSFENSFVSAYDSFLTQTSSTYSVQSLADTILWRISYEDLQSVYSTTEIGNFIGRKASESLFIQKSNREISLLSNTAEERYEKLFEERPELFKQIPLKYIASYIGITPQALSRIRRRIS